MDDDEDEEFDIPAIPARWLDFPIVVLVLLGGVAEEVRDFFDSLTKILAYHANYLNDQRRFADDVRTSLDSIPQTEE